MATPGTDGSGDGVYKDVSQSGVQQRSPRLLQSDSFCLDRLAVEGLLGPLLQGVHEPANADA
jgi:hypothetical protein